VLARLSLIARTIPFIPAYPLHPPQEKEAASAGRHCAADPEPEQHGQNDLRATGKPLCPLINSGRSKVEIRRVTASFARSIPSLACSPG
jgi:hypothetical protein